MKNIVLIFALVGAVISGTPSSYAEEHKQPDTRKDTYSEPHPNVKSNGCPEGEHVDERHQCVKNWAK